MTLAEAAAHANDPARAMALALLRAADPDSTVAAIGRASRWLAEPNAALGGLTPLSALDAGRFDEVIAAAASMGTSGAD